MTTTGRELTPQEVLADLFDSGEFYVASDQGQLRMAEITVQRLTDAGFEILPAEEVQRLRQFEPSPHPSSDLSWP